MRKGEWKRKVPNMQMPKWLPHSMIGRLIFMGSTSLLMILVLSAVIVTAQKNTKSNFMLTLGIMDANESINRDEYLNLQYLNSYDGALLEEMKKNMEGAKENLENIKVSSTYRADVKTIIQNIGQYTANMGQIISNNLELGADDTGIRKQMNDTQSQLEAQASAMNNLAGWVDIGMDSLSVKEHSIEVIDGKEYIKAVYTGPMPDCGRRNSFLVRIGAVGVDYTAKMYLTDLSFTKDEVTESYNLTENMQTISDYSYGVALQGMGATTFAGADAIETDCNFVAANQSWEEVTLNIPTASVAIEEYDSVSYTVYFENMDQVQWIAMGASLDQKFDFYSAYSNIVNNIQSYSSYVVYGDEEAAAATYELVLNDMAAFSANTDVYFSKNEPQTAGKELIQQYQEQLAGLKAINDQIISLNYENEQLKVSIKTSLLEVEEAVIDEVNSAEGRNIVLVSVFALVSAVVTGGLGAVCVQVLKKNMKDFSQVLQTVEKGNLKVRAREDGPNEFAQFGKTLNHFLDQLSNTLGSVQEVAEKVNKRNVEIADVIKTAVEGSKTMETNEQMKGILQLQQMFEEIGSNVMNQSASTEESLASLYDILEASKQAVKEINETTEASEKSLELVQTGASEVTVLADKMDGIAKSVAQASEDVMELIEDSKKIEQVLQAIENLASQTNLLSLNASIEASRAGEEGRGFAVVANEVKKLSGETTNETQKISEIINSINSKITQVQKANEQVIAHVQETHEITKEFSKVIQNMNDSTTLSAECIAGLKNRMNEQMASTEEIVKAVDQISADAQDIQNKTMETEEISKNLANILVENLEHVEEIREYGNQMDERVRFFQI